MGDARAEIRQPLQSPLGDKAWRWLAHVMGMPTLLATPPRGRETIALPAPLLSPDIIKAFRDMLGPDRVRQDDAARARHARGHSYLDLLQRRAGDLSSAPDAVLCPRGEDDVLAALALAARHGIGVIAFGSGGGRVGGVTAAPGRVSMDMSGMDRVIAVDPSAGTITAEAGITGGVLEKFLTAKSLTLEDFEFATLGGRIASGTATDGLCGARLATAHGVLSFEGASDGALKAMIQGSEGTLGVITQATLRTVPRTAMHQRVWRLPDFISGLAVLRQAPARDSRRWMFSDSGATAFAARLEALERKDRWRLGDIFHRDFAAESCRLVMRFDDEVSAHRTAKIVRTMDGVPEDFCRHWTAPQDYRDQMLDHGMGMETLEAMVSWPQLPALHLAVTRALEMVMQQHAPRPGAGGLVLGQLRPGSAQAAALSLICIFPRTLNDEIAQARAIRRAGMDAIIAHGGVFSHGTGEENLPWAEQEKGALGIAALRGLKRALDPENILNPGKRLPEEKNQA